MLTGPLDQSTRAILSDHSANRIRSACEYFALAGWLSFYPIRSELAVEAFSGTGCQVLMASNRVFNNCEAIANGEPCLLGLRSGTSPLQIPTTRSRAPITHCMLLVMASEFAGTRDLTVCGSLDQGLPRMDVTCVLEKTLRQLGRR